MDEPVSQLEQYGLRTGGINAGKQHDDVPPRPQYSMPGILHFLQTEWARFEMDRAQWEVDRAELQVSTLAEAKHGPVGPVDRYSTLNFNCCWKAVRFTATHQHRKSVPVAASPNLKSHLIWKKKNNHRSFKAVAIVTTLQPVKHRRPCPGGAK